MNFHKGAWNQPLEQETDQFQPTSLPHARLKSLLSISLNHDAPFAFLADGERVGVLAYKHVLLGGKPTTPFTNCPSLGNLLLCASLFSTLKWGCK